MKKKKEVGIMTDYCLVGDGYEKLGIEFIDMALKVQEISKTGNDAEVRFNADGLPKVYELARSLHK